MEKDTRPLFQITVAAHACGLSRSTLLRMEEKGLLAPAYIAPDSGRRYYDNHNVARVLQIEKLKAMGLGTEEIAGYFASGGEVTDLLSMLEERLRELLRGAEELRLRAGESGGMSIQIMTLPAVTCCTRRCEGHTIADKYNAMYDFTVSASVGAADSPTSRCSPSRSGGTIWTAISATRRTPIRCAFPCGRRPHPRRR